MPPPQTTRVCGARGCSTHRRSTRGRLLLPRLSARLAASRARAARLRVLAAAARRSRPGLRRGRSATRIRLAGVVLVMRLPQTTRGGRSGRTRGSLPLLSWATGPAAGRRRAGLRRIRPTARIWPPGFVALALRLPQTTRGGLSCRTGRAGRGRACGLLARLCVGFAAP